MNKKLTKLTVILGLGVIGTGCVSMDGRMVNAHGQVHDCSTSGGGFGLGMVVGAAIAAAGNQLCESDAEELGYILHDEVGVSGISFDATLSQEAIVLASEPPAYPCVMEGDRLVQVGQKSVSNLAEAKEAVFKESGDSLSLSLVRAES